MRNISSCFQKLQQLKNCAEFDFQDVGLLSQFICPHTEKILETIKTGDSVFYKRISEVILVRTNIALQIVADSNPSLFHFFEATITNSSNLIMCLPFNLHLGQCEHLLPRSLNKRHLVAVNCCP